MTEEEVRLPGDSSWSIDAMPYQALERERVKDNALLLYVVASASFVEITSDVYTRNLADFFHGDADVVAWLKLAWESEELQHGRALKRYVEIAWPDFDWNGAYRNFLAEFIRFCSVDQLAQTRALEMAARCVVETGTASFYRALAEMSPEPVLGKIAAAISADEVRHYKHFYRYFRRYRDAETPSRAAVFAALWRRLRMTGGDDSFIVLKHVYSAYHPGEPFDTGVYRRVRRECRSLVRDHIPHEMGVRMLLKPLSLGPRIQRMTLPVIAALARHAPL